MGAPARRATKISATLTNGKRTYGTDIRGAAEVSLMIYLESLEDSAVGA